MQTITLKTENNENVIEIIKNKQKLDITPIDSDDEDYKCILKGREERKKHPENYGSIDDIDWG